MRAKPIPSAAIMTIGFAIAAGAAFPASKPRAPTPSKPIDVGRFYVGRWYEIARTPMAITKDCVAGITDYSRTRAGQIFDTDSCRMKTPEGRQKTFAGPVTLLNPGANNEMRVRYKVFGIFRVSRIYWILDRGDDYEWFILSDPSFKHLSLFTRMAHPSAGEVMRLTERARSLGYDIFKLEYPAQSVAP